MADLIKFDKATTVPTGAEITANTVYFIKDVNGLGIAVADSTGTSVETIAVPTLSTLGLGNVNNTADADKPVSTATQTAIALKADLVAGKVPLTQIPDSVLGQLEYKGTYDMATALPAASTANKGEYYIASNATLANGYIIGDWAVSNGTSWDKIDNTDAVQTVQGRTGAVVITATDVGLGSVNNTADSAKPVSTAQQTALDLKAPLASPTFSGTVSDGSGKLRSIPTNAQAAYTLVAADNGKAIVSTGTTTVPASIFAAGDTIVVYNNSAAALTLTCSAVTAYITGTNTVKTSISLATRGMCTIFFYASNAIAVSGDVS
jgi:hypothetical protein